MGGHALVHGERGWGLAPPMKKKEKFIVEAFLLPFSLVGGFLLRFSPDGGGGGGGYFSHFKDLFCSLLSM